MKIGINLVFVVAALLLSVTAAAAQSAGLKSSAAYAEVVLRKTELMADLDAYGQDYTEANAKVLDARAELASLNRYIDRLLALKPSDTSRLTEALGRLIVKKAAIDADLAHLSRSYNKDHPEVRRVQRRADFFAAAIDDLLKQ